MTNPSAELADNNNATTKPSEEVAAVTNGDSNQMPMESVTQYVSMATQTSISSQPDMDMIEWPSDEVPEVEPIDTGGELSRSRPQSSRSRQRQLSSVVARHGLPLRESADQMASAVGFASRLLGDYLESDLRQQAGLENSRQEPNTCGAQHLSINYYDRRYHDP